MRSVSRTKSKAVASVGALAAGALLLAACTGGGDEGGGDVETVGDNPQSIKVLVSSGHQQFAPLWERLDEFTDETGIEVELEQVATTDIQTKVTQDLQAGGCTYDNVEMLDKAMAALAPLMAPLDPFIESEGQSMDDFRSEYVDWAIGSHTFDDSLRYYPFYSGARAIGYRVDLLENPDNQAAFEAEYGYDFPLPPQTPDELLDLAEFFTDGETYGLVASGAGDPAETFLADMIFRNGVPGYVDADNNSLWGSENPDNTARVQEVAEWVEAALRDRAVMPTEQMASMGTTETLAFYTSGQAAMVNDLIYLQWADFQTDAVTSVIGETGSFEIPSFDGESGGITFFWGRGIPECSDAQAESWEFMKWVMSESNQQLALSEGDGVYVPTNIELLDWAVQEGVLPVGVADSVTNASQYSQSIANGQITLSVHRPLVEDLVAGRLTPAEYAETSGADIQQTLFDLGLTQIE
ncbi:MAG: ABC transporter substrate-binding protein [Beutenbergiaceae bacterium]